MQHIKSFSKSSTLLLNEQQKNFMEAGRQVFSFGFGQSPFDPPRSVVDKLKAEADRKEYTPVQGLPEAQQAVADFYKHSFDVSCQAENVIIGPGSKILIYLAMAVHHPCDVLLPAPSWVSYEPQAKLCGHNVIRVNTTYENGWRVTPELLEESYAQKKYKEGPTLMVLNYPGNPEGLSYSEVQLKLISDSLAQHDIIVVADELYGPINHKGAHRPLVKDYPKTLTTTGLSKFCAVGGWRFGALIIPEALAYLKDPLIGLASETYSCASTPVQIAAVEALSCSSEMNAYVDLQRKVFSGVGNWCQQRLSKAGVNVRPPEGGFYLFLDFTPFKEVFAKHDIDTSEALCLDLMKETGVAILHGSAFGFDESFLSARLAYVNFDGASVLEKAKNQEVDEDFIAAYCPKVKEGIERLVGYLEAL